MYKNIFKLITAILFSGAFAFICQNIPYYEIVNTPETINLTKNDLLMLEDNHTFGNYINLTTNNENNVSKSGDGVEIILKIFDLFPIKKIKAQVYENEKVLASGELIGFNLKNKGVVVEGINSVLTEQGEICPAINTGLKVGDVITHINGIEVNTNEEFNELINIASSDLHTLTYIRGNILYETQIKSYFDRITKTQRIGLWVKDSSTGLGTLTYILPDNSYGALGHAVTDSNGEVVIADAGEIYDANLLGIERGQRGIAGSVKGIFVNDENEIGSITANTNVGLIGIIKNNNMIYQKAKEFNIGGRFSARPGNAQILCEVGEGGARLYDVEIIKASSQNNSKEKSMIIRVTDKELLELTGGIVQGMSGSPIIQDNRIVGAVTHVFINDPTKGYGIYLDWMLEKNK